VEYAKYMISQVCTLC